LLSVVPVAFIISAAYSSVPAVRSYLASLIRLRGVAGWSLLALILIPGLSLLSMVFSSLAGRQSVSAVQSSAAGPLLGLVAVKFLYQFFFFNCIGEEIGWRGFALPRLQAHTNPLMASLIIALFWPAWHLFLWQAEGNPVFSWQYWLEQYALHIAASVIIGWLYNRSRGSILVAGIAHAAANTASAFIPNFDWEAFMVTACAAALLMILVDRMWKKLPSDHPAVVQANGQLSEGAAPMRA
jgi:membrane protease YdiL (CAAX protease family)